MDRRRFATALPAGIAAALFTSGFALRLPLVGVGPLVPAIQADPQLDHAVLGLLITAPLLAVGLAALIAPRLASMLEPRTALGLALLAVGALGVLRVIPAGFAPIVALSVPLGIAVGMASAGLPLAIRAYLPTAPAKGTGAYALGLYVGAMVAAASAVPLADALGGWRAALASLSLGTVAAAVVWLAVARRRPASGPVDDDAAAAGSSWLVPGLGAAIAIYALRSSIFQGYNAWLPAMYVERGWDPATAGALLAALVGAGAVAVVIAAWLADWRGSRRVHLTVSAALLVAGSIGLVLWPALAWLWAVVAGAALGAQFTVSLTLPLDLAATRSSLVTTAAIVVGVGSLLAGVAPTLLGALRDVSGEFGPGAWLLAALSACLAVVSALLGRVGMTGRG